MTTSPPEYPSPVYQPTVACADIREVLDTFQELLTHEHERALGMVAHQVARLLERRGITIDYRPADEITAQPQATVADASPEGEALRQTDEELAAIGLRLTSLGGMFQDAQRPGADRCARARQLIDQTRKVIGALHRERITDQLLALGPGVPALGSDGRVSSEWLAAAVPADWPPTAVPAVWLAWTGARDPAELHPLLRAVTEREIALNDTDAVLALWRELNGDPGDPP